jgi:hypothetical protein
MSGRSDSQEGARSGKSDSQEGAMSGKERHKHVQMDGQAFGMPTLFSARDGRRESREASQKFKATKTKTGNCFVTMAPYTRYVPPTTAVPAAADVHVPLPTVATTTTTIAPPKTKTIKVPKAPSDNVVKKRKRSEVETSAPKAIKSDKHSGVISKFKKAVLRSDAVRAAAPDVPVEADAQPELHGMIMRCWSPTKTTTQR